MDDKIIKRTQEILERDPRLKYADILAYRGSLAHGTYIPDHIDDIDLMGVFTHRKEYYWGIIEEKDTQDFWIEEYDIVLYELKKFISLLAKGNPNVITLLWLDEDKYIYLSPIGKELIKHRDIFISKQIYTSFIGYAYSQLHRMTHPTFEGYMGDKRKKLVEEFGYDCKNASHCIRLIRMAKEFLLAKTFVVDRTNIDAKELLDIKNGLWKIEDIINEAKETVDFMDSIIDEIDIPMRVDREAINMLCINLIKYFK